MASKRRPQGAPRRRVPRTYEFAFIDSVHGKVPCRILHAADWDDPHSRCRVQVTQAFPPFEDLEVLDRPLLMVCPATALFPGPDGGWIIGFYLWSELVHADTR